VFRSPDGPTPLLAFNRERHLRSVPDRIDADVTNLVENACFFEPWIHPARKRVHSPHTALLLVKDLL
jgi:hypothetical protein